MTPERTSFGVCILTETFHPVTGGGETQARALAEGLQAASVTVNLITRRSDTALPARDLVAGIPVHRVGPAGRGHLRKWGMVLTALACLIRLRKHYRVILVCGYRVLGIPAMLVSRFSGRPCIIKADSQGELSGSFFDPGLARMKLRHDRLPVSAVISLRNLLLRRATAFIAISAVIEQEYLAHGVPPGRIVRIPNSVDTEKFRPVAAGEKSELRERLGIPRGRRVATFTGRLVTSKGLPSLLRAWLNVLPMYSDALLLLVGSGGLAIQNCEDVLKRFAGEHGLDEKVLFPGSVDNVHEYLQASDLFVFPSEREAFGISIIEAMACRLPIVTTAVDGISDIVRPDVDALVVPPADDDALAAAIKRGLAGGEEIVRMSEAARQRAVAEFSSATVVASYRDLMAELLR